MPTPISQLIHQCQLVIYVTPSDFINSVQHLKHYPKVYDVRTDYSPPRNCQNAMTMPTPLSQLVHQCYLVIYVTPSDFINSDQHLKHYPNELRTKCTIRTPQTGYLPLRNCQNAMTMPTPLSQRIHQYVIQKYMLPQSDANDLISI